MKQSEQIDQLATALAAFQGEMPSIDKSHTAKIPTKSGGEFSYKYADLADTVKTAAPKATAHGLSVVQMPSYRPEVGDVLTTRVMHISGQWLEDTMRLFLAKEDPQTHGSAITYARRYAYCAALGIVADEDDDGAAATQSGRPVRAEVAKAATRRRESPLPTNTVLQMDKAKAKEQVLQAAGGDMIMAKNYWDAAGGVMAGDMVPVAALNTLLERLQAELNKGNGAPL